MLENDGKCTLSCTYAVHVAQVLHRSLSAPCGVDQKKTLEPLHPHESKACSSTEKSLVLIWSNSNNTKGLTRPCSFNISFLTEPPQDLDPQTRTKTRQRWMKWGQIFWGPALLFGLTVPCCFAAHMTPPFRSYSSTSFEDAMKKAEEPPTPPPRPQKTHSRASSLDLNKLFQQGAPGADSLCRHSRNSLRAHTHSERETTWSCGAFHNRVMGFCFCQFSFHGRTKRGNGDG